MKTKRIAALVVALLAVTVFAQQVIGITTITPIVNAACYTLPHKGKFVVQANMTAQDYSATPYVFSSVNVWLAPSYVRAEVGAPVGGGSGYVDDGGVSYWAVKPAVVLKDTDTFSFTALSSNMALCYKAGTTADGGVSAMTLSLHEVVR